MFLTDVFDEKHVFARIVRRAENVKGVFVYVRNDFAVHENRCFFVLFKKENTHMACCEKYKPYILKYKALILKYVPYIFCEKQLLIFRYLQKRKNRIVLMPAGIL